MCWVGEGGREAREAERTCKLHVLEYAHSERETQRTAGKRAASALGDSLGVLTGALE